MIKTGIDGWVITADTYQYVLGRMVTVKDKRAGGEKESLRVHGYYGTVARAVQALYALLSRELVQTDELTLNEAVQALHRLQTRFAEIIAPIKDAERMEGKE